MKMGIPGNNATARSRKSAAHVREIRRVTVWGLILNLALSAVKFLAGIIGVSQALIADAVHSISDCTTDVAVLVGARFWTAPADESHPHGHGRIETMITFLIGGALAAVGAGLVYRALATLGQSHTRSPGWIAFGAACLSLVSKELLYRWTAAVGKRIRSTALIANAWHHRSDGLSSLPVAIAVLGTKLRPEWYYLDHVATVIVAVFIFQAAWGIAYPALRQLVDAGASEEERSQIDALGRAVEGVRRIHRLRTRHIGTGLQVDLHVQVDPEISVQQGHVISGKVKKKILDEGPDVVDVLIHIEPDEGDN